MSEKRVTFLIIFAFLMTIAAKCFVALIRFSSSKTIPRLRLIFGQSISINGAVREDCIGLLIWFCYSDRTHLAPILIFTAEDPYPSIFLSDTFRNWIVVTRAVYLKFIPDASAYLNRYELLTNSCVERKQGDSVAIFRLNKPDSPVLDGIGVNFFGQRGYIEENGWPGKWRGASNGSWVQEWVAVLQLGVVKFTDK